MSDFKLFYKVSSEDRYINVDDIYIKKPKPLAILEENAISSVVKFGEKMKYYKPPKLDDYPLDLNVGFDYLNSRPEVETKWILNKVCFYLMNKGDLIQSVEESGSSNYEDKSIEDCDEMECNYEVFCHLGLLRGLMRTPYANSKFKLEWSVFATFFNNKLYLINKRQHNGMDRDSSHYFKFEQYCFSNDPQEEPDASGPLDDENKIRFIFCTELKNFKLVYSTDVNGFASNQKLENLKDVKALQQYSLVQTMLMRYYQNDTKFLNWKKNYRMLNWWIKAHLAAVDVMYVGFKTSDGFVQEPAERILVKDLTQNQRWTPKVCYQFLYNFIKMVIGIMREVNSPYTCYEFHYDFSTDLINYRIHEGKTEYSFLHEDYIAYLMK